MLSKDYSAEALGTADRRAGEDARGDRQSTCGSGCCDAVLTAGYGSIPVTAKPSGNILTVGVEYGVDYHAAARFGRRHDVDRHSLRERPAHHHAAVQADYRERAQHPLAGPQIRNVVHKLVGGNGAGEVAPGRAGIRLSGQKWRRASRRCARNRAAPARAGGSAPTYSLS